MSLSPAERDVLLSLCQEDPLIQYAKGLIFRIKSEIGVGGSHELGGLQSAVAPICSLIASKRLRQGDVSFDQARAASCLSSSDFKTAYSKINGALKYKEATTSPSRKQDVKLDSLAKEFGLDENVHVTLNELLHKLKGASMSSTSHYALFRWVVLTAEAVSEEGIDNYLVNKGHRLEPIRRECKHLDSIFQEEKHQIRKWQSAAGRRVHHRANLRRSPTKSLYKRFSVGVPNTPTRSKVLEQFEQLKIKATPKRKLEVHEAMDVDSVNEEASQSPTKRNKICSNETTRTMLDGHRRQRTSASSFPKPQQTVVRDLGSTPQWKTSLQTQPTWPSYSDDPDDSVSHILLEEHSRQLRSVSRKSTVSQMPGELLSEDVEENRPASPMLTRIRQIPLCGTRRELYLDRKPWLEIDRRMQKHLMRFQILLQSVERL